MDGFNQHHFIKLPSNGVDYLCMKIKKTKRNEKKQKPLIVQTEWKPINPKMSNASNKGHIWAHYTFVYMQT